MVAAVVSPVVIDLENDDLVPVAQVCRERFGKRMAPSTQWRWIRKGISAGGQRVKLAAMFHAGVWVTTRAAFAAFIRAQTEAALAAGIDHDEPVERSESTAAKLRAAGVL